MCVGMLDTDGDVDREGRNEGDCESIAVGAGDIEGDKDGISLGREVVGSCVGSTEGTLVVGGDVVVVENVGMVVGKLVTDVGVAVGL